MTQKSVCQKWPDQIFPMVNFVFSHDAHFGLWGGGGRLQCCPPRTKNKGPVGFTKGSALGAGRAATKGLVSGADGSLLPARGAIGVPGGPSNGPTAAVEGWGPVVHPGQGGGGAVEVGNEGEGEAAEGEGSDHPTRIHTMQEALNAKPLFALSPAGAKRQPLQYACLCSHRSTATA